jgi:prepilin-type N-terminal cleavage/methylation domain-containing protein
MTAINETRHSQLIDFTQIISIFLLDLKKIIIYKRRIFINLLFSSIGSKMHYQRRTSGFTLLELVMVIAIITIVGAISTPAYLNYIASSRLKSNAVQIYSLLQEAKMLAIKNGAPSHVFFDTSSSPPSMTIYSDQGTNASWNNGGDDKVYCQYCFESTIKYGHGDASVNATASKGTYFASDNVTHGGNDLDFTALGTSNPPSGYVYIQNANNESYSIGTLSPTGLINIKHWTGENWR